MSTPSKSVNAWILASEDEPKGSSYTSRDSSFQNLITYGVYDSTDMVNICFANTVPTSSTTVPPGDGSTYTIQIESASHPDGYTNQQYMDWIIRDAKATNQNIRVLITLNYNYDEFTQIFSGPQSGWQEQCDVYAANLVAYLHHYGLAGFDVDWEGGFATSITQQQFAMLFTAIGKAFDAAPGDLLLTMSPSMVGHLDSATVNTYVDFINLQNYSGATQREFTNAGVDADLLAYGAKFETDFGVPYQTAQQAYQAYTEGGYTITTQWRLNSGDFQYEQAQQMILYQLIEGVDGNTFDDAPIIGAAGYPGISQMVVRAGDVLDSIQVTNTGSFSGNPVTYTLLQHGGNGGTANTIDIAEGDSLVEVSGYTGLWFGTECVLQITLKTANGTVYGPFGSMEYSSDRKPFTLKAEDDRPIVAFSGSLATVTLSGGGLTQIITSLDAKFAPILPEVEDRVPALEMATS